MVAGIGLIDTAPAYGLGRSGEIVGKAIRGKPDRVAIEMDAACVVVNLFMLPDEPDLFRQCVQNIARVRADCDSYRMPLMIEPLAMLPVEQGGHMVDGDAEKIVTLTRLAREMGADVVKADPIGNAEDFHRSRGGAAPCWCAAAARKTCAPCSTSRRR